MNGAFRAFAQSAERANQDGGMQRTREPTDGGSWRSQRRQDPTNIAATTLRATAMAALRGGAGPFGSGSVGGSRAVGPLAASAIGARGDWRRWRPMAGWRRRAPPRTDSSGRRRTPRPRASETAPGSGASIPPTETRGTDAFAMAHDTALPFQAFSFASICFPNMLGRLLQLTAFMPTHRFQFFHTLQVTTITGRLCPSTWRSLFPLAGDLFDLFSLLSAPTNISNTHWRPKLETSYRMLANFTEKLLIFRPVFVKYFRSDLRK